MSSTHQVQLSNIFVELSLSVLPPVRKNKQTQTNKQTLEGKLPSSVFFVLDSAIE